MGNFENIMHSLRLRFSSSKSKAFPASSSSTASSQPSPVPIFDRYGSSCTLRTSPSSISDASIYTPPTTPSESPRSVYKNEPVLDSPHEVQEAVPSAAQAEEITEHSDASPYAELAASLAMLDFARKLPLEELTLVDFSDYNHAERHAMAVEPKQPPQPIDCVAKPQSSVPEVQQFSSHTLGLSSESSGTAWSFACRSARRIEGEHELPGINEDTATSFGSLSRWDVGDIAEPSPLRVQQVHHALNMSDAEFDALLDYSDIEDDPAYDEPFIRDADVWSVSSAASSNTDEVYEETDEIEAPNNHPAFMSDSDFDALPNCSDVEDDPEYNTQFERDEDIWSVTSTDSEETLVVPDIYDEDGFLDDAKDRLEEVTLRAKADEKKRKQESEGNDIPSKRRKLQQEILLMQEDIMRFEF